MINDHPYLDNNGPTYMYGVCDHSTCGPRTAGHACPGTRCGQGVLAHSTMLRADKPRGQQRVVAVDQGTPSDS